MANEINIVIQETGLTLVAKIWSGNTQVGSNINLTENSNRSGHYYGDAPGSITDGVYVLIIETNGGIIKGSNEVQFIDNSLQSGNLLKLDELWKLQGLKSGTNLIVTPTSRTAGTIVLAISGDGENSATISR